MTLHWQFSRLASVSSQTLLTLSLAPDSGCNDYFGCMNGTGPACCIDCSGYSGRNDYSGLRQLRNDTQYRTVSVARERERLPRGSDDLSDHRSLSGGKPAMSVCPEAACQFTESGILSSAWLSRMKNRSSSFRHAVSGGRHFSRVATTRVLDPPCHDIFPSCTPRERDHEETFQQTFP